jgi:hypothetical protein
MPKYRAAGWGTLRTVRVLAVDWSGKLNNAAEFIWLAEVRSAWQAEPESA